MPNVVFVAPFFLDATIRFVEAAADLPGVRFGLVSQDPFDRLPASLREKTAQHWRVANALDPQGIVEGVRGIEARIGRVERLVGTLEQLQVPLALAREELGLRGLSVEAARNFRDKSRMKDVLRRHGLPCARHRLAATAADAAAFAEEVGFPIVGKPPEGAGAKATWRAGDLPTLLARVEASRPSAASPVLLEEFVTGEEHSFDTVSIRGKPVWHSLSRYVPSPLTVLENPWIQWCVLVPREVDHPRFDDIRRIGWRALEALGMDTGVTHMEWFRREDGGVCLSEVAARPPGAQFCSLISYAHDLDFYRAWARLAVYEEFEIPDRCFAAGAAYLRGQGRGRVVGVRGLDEVRREVGHLIVETKIPEVGQGPSGSYEGEGYVIVRHEETEVVEWALRRIVSVVRVDLG